MPRSPEILDVHVHPVLDEPVTAIGGYYELTSEHTLVHAERTVLYATGFAEVDSSCCGVDGCAFAVVSGFLVEADIGDDDRGNRRCAVERVRDEDAKRAIRQQLEAAHPITQVTFR